MRLDISYVKPCGEKGRLAARVDMQIDPESVRKAAGGDYSPALGVLRTEVNGLSVIVYRDHVDISDADFEHEIVEALRSIRETCQAQ
jgi:hypothetical protein